MVVDTVVALLGLRRRDGDGSQSIWSYWGRGWPVFCPTTSSLAPTTRQTPKLFCSGYGVGGGYTICPSVVVPVGLPIEDLATTMAWIALVVLYGDLERV